MRIIAGLARGQTLRVPPGDRTRPTTDRVREAIFSFLTSWTGDLDAPQDAQLAGLRVLDLFAGSGAIAIEALSRGARQVVLVESDRGAAEVIRANLAATSTAGRAQLVTSTVNAYLSGPATSFDVVWADPPYVMGTQEVNRIIAEVAAKWLADDGIIIVERSCRDESITWPRGFADTWQRSYGETVCCFGRPARNQEEQ